MRNFICSLDEKWRMSNELHLKLENDFSSNSDILCVVFDELSRSFQKVKAYDIYREYLNAFYVKDLMNFKDGETSVVETYLENGCHVILEDNGEDDGSIDMTIDSMLEVGESNEYANCIYVNNQNNFAEIKGRFFRLFDKWYYLFNDSGDVADEYGLKTVFIKCWSEEFEITVGCTIIRIKYGDFFDRYFDGRQCIIGVEKVFENKNLITEFIEKNFY